MKDIAYSLNFERVSGGVEVDVRIINEAPLAFQYHVIKTGKLIFCRDDKRRGRFEVRVMSEYFDFKPILDYYNKCMYQNIREGYYGPGLRIGERSP
ncbi:MAG: nucleotidyltransferase domain-containing protein [bacterium]